MREAKECGELEVFRRLLGAADRAHRELLEYSKECAYFSRDWEGRLGQLRESHRATMKEIRQAAAALDVPEQVACWSDPKSPLAAQCVYLGSGKLRIGDATIGLTESRWHVVEALVKARAATTRELVKASGHNDAVAILKRTMTAHPELTPFFTFPGPRGKGKGGYATTVEDESDRAH
jgi:hypothetical protein